jgi:hypothetical protein
MADNNGNSAPQFSMPPSMGGMPGQAGQQQGFENGNGQGMSSQPPLGLNIPQNNNPLPMDMSDANGLDGLGSPMSAGGTIRRAAPEPNKRALYVGGLDPRVTEEVLRQIFETTGHVQNVKIIPDKNVSHFAKTHSLHPHVVKTFHVIHVNCSFVSVTSPARLNMKHMSLLSNGVQSQHMKASFVTTTASTYPLCHFLPFFHPSYLLQLLVTKHFL